MSDRDSQEFWDKLWYWEKYERYPTESVDDPHLVVQLAGEVDAAGNSVDPNLFSRYDHCVGRVIQRLTDLFPRSGDTLDETELKHWLAFGLDPAVRGHVQAITPIIDANSLVTFRFFVRHALDYCERHGLADLKNLWETVSQIAEEVDAEHVAETRDSRFDAAGRGGG